MRAISGRQLLEEGVISDEVCDWDEDDEIIDSVVADQTSIISQQSLARIRSSVISFDEAIISAAPNSEAAMSHAFNDLFDSAHALSLTEDGGIKKLALYPGAGPIVSEKDVAYYHYSCYKEGCKEPVFTSYLHEFPVRLRIGMGIGNCLPCHGVDVAIRSMRTGETSLFLMNPSYGYGSLGIRKVGLLNNIPRNAWLLWKIQLIKIEPATECDDLLLLASAEERHSIPFEKLYQIAEDEKKKGTSLFYSEEYIGAMRCYKRALRLMQEAIPRDEKNDVPKLKALTVKLLTNLAQTSLKRKRNIECCSYCDKVLELDENNCTAVRKKVEALIRLEEYKNAHKYLAKWDLIAVGKDRDGLEEARRRLAENENKSRANTRELERIMAKGLFVSNKSNPSKKEFEKKSSEQKKESVSAHSCASLPNEFKEIIVKDFEQFSSDNSENLTYECCDLGKEELDFIKDCAQARGLSWTKIDAEIGRQVLIIQSSSAKNTHK